MKMRLGRVLASVLVLGLLAVVTTACGGSGERKVTAGGPVVTTMAGKAGSPGSADGTGAAARFDRSQGIACDTAGNLYVADTYNDTIRKITPAGVVTTLAGKAGSKGSADGTGAAARFNGPHGVAIDLAGNLYVTDTFNSTVRQITPAGVVTTLAGKAGSQGGVDGTGAAARFHQATGITCDTAGNVYVTDWGNDTIRKITPAGEVTTVAGKAGFAGGADGIGAAARFAQPDGITCDAAGNLYVANTGDYAVRKITPAGVVTTLAGKAGSQGSADGTGAAARFTEPYGITIDAAGDVYVSDNDTIRKITSAGVVTTLVGKAGTLGSADGSGAVASFYGLAGIARDAAGNLYGADSENYIIRKITGVK